EKSYLAKHPGHYLTGDAGYRDEDGYVYIMSRVDDIINVAGHRLSTGGMEEVLAAHPDVAECAVVGVADEIKGEVPVGFVVTQAGVARSDGPVRGVQDGARRAAPAEDALGQDPARHDQEDRRRPRVGSARDDRRPDRSGRDHRGAPQER